MQAESLQPTEQDVKIYIPQSTVHGHWVVDAVAEDAEEQLSVWFPTNGRTGEAICGNGII